MVLHLSSDLMLVGKVSAWARSNEMAYQNVSTLEKFRVALADSAADVVMIDLQFRGLNIPELATEVRDARPQSRLAGYAQHVMTDLIDAAQAANFDVVMTRGQFDRQFADLMQ
ncbi:MAG: hypothetical protein ACR2NP_19135 [Pirellulaceae bacterium]